MAKKKLKGIVKRISGKNTVAVEVVSVYHHPRYRKRILTSKSYLAQVEDASAVVGKSVTIEESRPISKTKRWIVFKVEGKSIGVGRTANGERQEPKAVSRKRKAVSQRRKEKSK